MPLEPVFTALALIAFVSSSAWIAVSLIGWWRAERRAQEETDDQLIANLASALSEPSRVSQERKAKEREEREREEMLSEEFDKFLKRKRRENPIEEFLSGIEDIEESEKQRREAEAREMRREKRIELHQRELDAIAQVLRFHLEEQGRRSRRDDILLNSGFFILGAAASYLISVVLGG